MKKWAPVLWPLGGSVLGLVVFPVAIEQYPEVFKESRWILPLSVAAAGILFIVPLLSKERLKRIFAVGTRAVGIPLTLLCLAFLVGAFVYSLTWLYNFHCQHLEARLKKQEYPNRSLTQSAGDGLYVTTEVELTSAGAPGQFTGFWVGHYAPKGYTVLPVTEMEFVRITNLLSTPVMLTRFDATTGLCPDGEKLETDNALMFWSQPIGSRGTPVVGRTVDIKNNGTGRGLYMTPINTADLSRANMVAMPLLERGIANSYLMPNQSIGGWIFFSSRCMGVETNVHIEDAAGRKMEYHLTGRNDSRSGDLATHPFVIGRQVNLTKATVIRPGRIQ